MLRKPPLGPLCDSEKGNSGKINTSSVWTSNVLGRQSFRAVFSEDISVS